MRGTRSESKLSPQGIVLNPHASGIRTVLPGGHASRRPLRKCGLLSVSGYYFETEDFSAHAEKPDRQDAGLEWR